MMWKTSTRRNMGLCERPAFLGFARTECPMSNRELPRPKYERAEGPHSLGNWTFPVGHWTFRNHVRHLRAHQYFPRSAEKKAGIVLAGLLALVLSVVPQSVAETHTNNLPTASFDELLIHLQTYGSTEIKRELKKAAREEFLERGAASLAYVMNHIVIENMWITIMGDQLVRKLPEDQAVAVLLPFVTAPKARTRKFAAYWLGFHQAPEHSPALIPLLVDDDTAGSAIRTLGKWKASAAVDAIRPYLASENERLRIRTVNALRDIGDERSIPDLMAATGDPVFTVRKAATRALVTYAEAAAPPVRAALPTASPLSRRELITVLGGIGGRRNVAILRKLLADADPLVRDSAVRALLVAEPEKAPGWLTRVGIDAGILGMD